MTASNKTLSAETAWTRIRRAVLWLLFAGLLMIPKFLALRRRRRAWNAARLVAALLGAGLLAAGWAGLLHGTGAAAAGVVLVILALAIPPQRSLASLATAIDARAKELGAVIVVRGGSYRAADGAAIETRFFVGLERLWILTPAFDPLFVVPIAGLFLLRAEAADDGWKLCLAWDAGTAEFLFRGPFAEHFARVAESTVRSQIPRALPILR